MSKRKLLLADDSVTVQKVVNLAFEAEDIEVITADDGNSAFEKFVEFSPDIVLADINMSGADGYEICERIKEDAETRHIPVILLVGSFVPFSEERAERVGANGFLKKPFQSINLLISKVTELLDMNGADDSAASEIGFSEADTQPMPAYQTPEMPKFEDDFSTDKNPGEIGMDDEMIETERVADYSFADETSKYETNTGFDFGASDDVGQTQPTAYSEVEEQTFGGQLNEETSEETVYELADEPDDYPPIESYDFNEEPESQSDESYDFNKESESQSDETTKESIFDKSDYYEGYSAYRQPEEAETVNFPAPESAAALNLDEFELLELPPLETEPETAPVDYAATAEMTKPVLTPDNSEVKTAEEKTDYSSYAETAEEDFYSIPQPKRSLDTQSGYYAPTEEPATDFDSSETQPQTVEESPETTKSEVDEKYYLPASETETVKDDSEFEQKEEISTADSEESTSQDFTEKEEATIQTEFIPQTQALIAEETHREISKADDKTLVVHYLPPEVIDEIAERVVEKLAEKLRR